MTAKVHKSALEFTYSSQNVTRIAVAILALGAVWRIIQYFLRFPIWGDEAMLASSLVKFGYGDLLYRLENSQIAPILFLWAEHSVISILGPSDLALRLVPLVAGLGSLAVFWQLTSLVLSPNARLFAIGFLAVGSWPVSMCSLTKPYSLDLFMSLSLSLLAVKWMRRPEQLRWVIALAVVAPIAVLSSYPAIFVCGAVSLSMVREVYQQDRRIRFCFVIFNLTMLASFAFGVWVGSNHLANVNGSVSTRDFMNSYWASAYPPDNFFSGMWWLLLTTTGQMMAYPIGSAHGGSIVTAVLFGIGVLYWCRHKQWPFLLLFVGPIFLNLLAAILHRYPYGASGRLSQHLAPGICIIAAVGTLAFQSRPSWTPRRQWHATMALTLFFALVGVSGIAFNVVRPYRDRQCLWARTTMDDICKQIGSDEHIVMCARTETIDPVFVWYWLAREGNVHWEFELPRLESCHRIWGFHHGDDAETAEREMLSNLQRRDADWRVVRRSPYDYATDYRHLRSQRCVLFCFERRDHGEEISFKVNMSQ